MWWHLKKWRKRHSRKQHSVQPYIQPLSDINVCSCSTMVICVSKTWELRLLVLHAWARNRPNPTQTESCCAGCSKNKRPEWKPVQLEWNCDPDKNSKTAEGGAGGGLHAAIISLVTSVGLLGYNWQRGGGCKKEAEARQRECWEEWTSSDSRSASLTWSASCFNNSGISL